MDFEVGKHPQFFECCFLTMYSEILYYYVQLVSGGHAESDDWSKNG